MTRPSISELAQRLDEATRSGRATAQLSATTALSLSDAYAVQHAALGLRLARGERLVGLKLGFTSRAKAQQMGVDDVIIGSLTSGMALQDGEELDLASGVHPRVEPEIAFRVSGGALGGGHGGDPLAAVTHVAPALEVIDSRYQDFRFSLEDVVADNTSASRFVVGRWHPLEEVVGRLDLADLPVRLTVDGEEVAHGSTADILGDPLSALPTTARLCTAFGHALPEGGTLLAGSATVAVELRPGTRVVSEVAGLGSVSVTVAGTRR